MDQDRTSPFARLMRLALGSLSPPPGRARIATALIYGVACHLLFALAVLAMIVGMFFGMGLGLGTVPAPWSWAVNAMLIVQFPLVHSVLLTPRGAKILSRLAPGGHGGTLATTTFAIIASLQLVALFTLWTPSGVILWQAEGWVFALFCAFYAMSWLLLIWASYDAGAEVQSGALGWMSLMQNVKPVFPDMPTTGLFALIRQPIYVAFALTTWTAPVWTPDQVMLALALTVYCLAAPLLKERRFAKRYGARFEAYKHRVPYAVPIFAKQESR